MQNNEFENLQALCGSFANSVGLSDQWIRAVDLVDQALQENDCQIDEAELICRHPELAAELRQACRARKAVSSLFAQLNQNESEPRNAHSTVWSGQLEEFRGQAIAAEAFIPGQILQNRYRIIRLAGQGGMASVYKVEDLKLGQAVAIKVLPSWLSENPQAVARFREEVRLARSLSHPHLCRVYDLLEIDGLHVMTMEFIEGETLAELIDRVGCPHPEEAIRISRQLCAGLVEAHRNGIVHRDLKPSNVMLDKRCNVRITDFGLALEEASSCGIIAGTLEYMAPEQLRGEEPTTKSDIYSLGLVLAELFNGRRTRTDDSVLFRTLLHPSGIASTIDLPTHVPSAIRLVIRNCLAASPDQRPSSPADVAQVFPSRDLGNYLNAVDIPEPELIAAAEIAKPLSTRFAITCFCVFVLSLLGVAASSSQHRIHDRSGLSKSPAELHAKALEVLNELGVEPQKGANRAFGFSHLNHNYSLCFDAKDKLFCYWYRQSMEPLRSTLAGIGRGSGTLVTFSDPAIENEGDLRILLWSDGTVRNFGCVVGDEIQLPLKSTTAKLFALAGLPESDFEVSDETSDAATSIWLRRPGVDNEINRVNISKANGQLERFYAVAQPPPPTVQSLDRVADSIDLVCGAVLLFVALINLRSNIRSGQADLYGAWRLAAVVLLCSIVSWVWRTHHAANFADELQLAEAGFANAGLWSFMAWLFYVALEPVVRRTRPEHLISWNRLLRARWNDPILGKDVLSGLTIATVSITLLMPLNSYVRGVLAAC